MSSHVALDTTPKQGILQFLNLIPFQIPFPGAGDNLKGVFNKVNSMSKDIMCSPESYTPSRRFLICFLLLADKLSGPVSMSEVSTGSYVIEWISGITEVYAYYIPGNFVSDRVFTVASA